MTKKASKGRKAGRVARSGRRILIVDDEGQILKVVLRVISISMPGCKTDVVVNGAEALESFRVNRHPVIVMDVKMAGMDGETALDEIQKICDKENWEVPAVVFFSGFPASEKMQNILKSNALHTLLMKPVEPSRLVEALQSRLPPV